MGTRTRFAAGRRAGTCSSLACPPTAGRRQHQAPAFPASTSASIGQSKKLVVFTTEFKANATQYNKLAAAANYDYAGLWRRKPARSSRCSRR